MFRALNILFALIFFLPADIFALSTDAMQNMHIIADSTLFNYKSGFNTYDGNVRIDQGSTRLNADRVTTQNDAHHKMQEATAYGFKKPAHYWTTPKEGDLTFNAQATIIKFYPIKSLVVLEGNVVVTQGNNSFHGPIMYYNIKDQTVTSPQNKNGHATIIIEPDQISI